MASGRLVVVLSLAVVLLAATSLWLGRQVQVLRRPAEPPDDESRRSAAAALAESAEAFYDAHPDQDVGRVLSADQHRATLATNAYGMRERPYALPKPAGTLRVVLLGDSFVFGWGVEADQRLGVLLERWLRERSGPDAPDVECLHLGVPSWNLLAECAFLRRQLDRLQPDLVLHFTVHNDLDDVTGVRGFGAQAAFVPAHRERADGFVGVDHPSRVFGFHESNVLPLGLDGESRERFAEVGARIAGLIADLARLEPPARYVLVAHWGPALGAFHRELGSALEPAWRFYLPERFFLDESNAVGGGDVHWGPLGHERVARALYGLILERGLLPQLGLAPWPEAVEEARRLDADGLADARAGLGEVYRRALDKLSSTVDLDAFDARQGLQVYGGIGADGLVSPHAVLVLRSAGASVLELRGEALPERVLEGATVRVQLDGVDVARFALEPGAPILVRASVPPELSEREFLALRLISSDHVLRGADLRRCVSWRLARAALLP